MSASRLGESDTEFQPVITTPPQARKRKSAGSEDNLSASSKKQKLDEVPDAALPVTPQTTPSTPIAEMDSDDDFMSGASSQDFDDDIQDSDDESLGMSSPHPRSYAVAHRGRL